MNKYTGAPITIPSTVTYIGANAFTGNAGVTINVNRTRADFEENVQAGNNWSGNATVYYLDS
jgi:hypothetical protein